MKPKLTTTEIVAVAITTLLGAGIAALLHHAGILTDWAYGFAVGAWGVAVYRAAEISATRPHTTTVGNVTVTLTNPTPTQVARLHAAADRVRREINPEETP